MACSRWLAVERRTSVRRERRSEYQSVMELMDRDERKELIEMLVDNSLSERVVQRQQVTEKDSLDDQVNEPQFDEFVVRR